MSWNDDAGGSEERDFDMSELRSVLQTLYDNEAHSGTLNVDELETLRLIIEDLASYKPGHAEELEDNLLEATNQIRELERALEIAREELMKCGEQHL